MYKTGDINKNLERLKIELKKIKYSVEIFESENISNGNPVYFLPIIHYVILDYSKHIAKTLVDNNYELFSKSDQEFVSKVFKALIELFNFKPNITIKQFFSFGYSEAKVILCLEIIRIIKGEHNNLIKKAYLSKPPVNKARRTNGNDSFRSVRNNEVDSFLDYSSNLGYDTNIKVREDFGKKVKNKLPVHQFIEEDFPNTTSPKFSENPNYAKKNYNFDRRVLKREEENENSENLEKVYKEKHRNIENAGDYSEDGDASPDKNYLPQKKIHKINNGNKAQNINNAEGDLYNKFTEKEVEYLNYEVNQSDENEGDDPKTYIYNNEGVANCKNQINYSNRYKEYDSNHLEKNITENRKTNTIKEKEVRDDYIINFKENPEKISKKIKCEKENPENIEEYANNIYNKEFKENNHPSNMQNNKKEHIHSNSNKQTRQDKDQNLSQDINSHSNYQPVNHHGNPPIASKNRQNNNNTNNLIEFSSLIEIINSLANSVKDMTGKVDDFKTNIENRVEKLEAELTLIKNRLSIIENKNSSSSFSNQIQVPNRVIYNTANNNTVHNQESNLNNTNEENEHIFSFADDPNSNFLHNQLANKLETICEDVKKTSSEKNKIVSTSNYGKIENINKQNNYNNNTFSHKAIIKESNAYNNHSNKLPNKILNDIEDTDTIIQRIANRFKETQKLLNEFK